jgi:hypothetical protein
MSAFGERIKFSENGSKEYICPHTGEEYYLDGDNLVCKKKLNKLLMQ